MATQTTTLHLNKPAYTEAADIAVVNGNMDTIDTWATSTNQSIGNLSNLTTTEKGSLVGAANELNSKFTPIDVSTNIEKNDDYINSMTNLQAYTFGKLCVISMMFDLGNVVGTTSTTLFSGLPRPSKTVYCEITAIGEPDGSNTTSRPIRIETTGTIQNLWRVIPPSGYTLNVSYIMA